MNFANPHTNHTQPIHLLIIADADIGAQCLRYLQGAGFIIDLLQESRAAIARLESEPAAYHAILLQRDLPDGSNGLELLQHLKTKALLQTIPVIMQTRQASDEDIISGLASGAYYYLVSPVDPQVLLAVVRAATAESSNRRAIRAGLLEQQRALPLLDEAVFDFRTLEDTRRLTAFIAALCPHPERVSIGLFELLINAIEHGNLGITYADKSRLNLTGTWEDEVNRRLHLPENLNKHAELKFLRQSDGILITVTDQGTGFDWEKYLELHPERAFDSHGRGIYMSKTLSFDRLCYIAPGNCVEVFLANTPTD